MRVLPALVLLPLLLPRPGLAQVSTNSDALDTLGPAAKPAASPAKPAPTPKRATRHAAHPVHTAARLPATPIPAAPPANPVIVPPPFTMPAHKPPPPPPVTVKPDAAGAAMPIAGATRITFGPATADLNPATAAALQTIAADAKANPAMQITITAWAPGTPEDPSTPRRLSLDRALAARAMLINAGIVSDRIHAVAKGFTDIGAAAPDRADVAEILPSSSKPAPAQPSAAKP